MTTIDDFADAPQPTTHDDDARGAQSPLPPVPPPTRRALVFTGTGRGYFRIWIVNLLLTVVTAGLYSPWAKVRKLRYLYGNTMLDGSAFEFHGRPLALLKGRLIGLVLLVAYTQARKVSLTFWIVVVAVLVALLPWLLWKSFRFRLGNSSYRGIHAAFDGTVGQAYLVFVPLTLAVFGPTILLVVAEYAMQGANDRRGLARYYGALSLATLLVPWFYFRLRAYQHRNARIGTTAFAFDGRVGAAYGIALKLALFGFAFGFVGFIAGMLAGGLTWIVAGAAMPSVAKMAGIGTGVAIGYLVFIGGNWSFARAMIQNYVWNHTRLGDSRFESSVGRFRLWTIELANVALTLCTLGLYWPFAVVRSVRYRVQSVTWDGDSEALTSAGIGASGGATGEETADLFGLDIAL